MSATRRRFLLLAALAFALAAVVSATPVSAAPHPAGTRALAAPRAADDPGELLPSGAVARMGRRPSRRGPLAAVAFSPDGRLIAGAVDGGDAVLWERATGRVLRTLPGTLTATPALAFSPDGKLLATTGGSGVHLWEVKSGRQVHRLGDEKACYGGVGFADGGRTVVGVEDFGVRRWEAATGKELGHVEYVHIPADAHAVSPDGRLVAVPWGLLDARTGREVGRLQGRPEGFYEVQFSADGKLVVAASADGDDRRLRSWEAPGGREVRRFGGRYALHESRIALSRDGKLVAYAGWTKPRAEGGKHVAELRDAATGKRVRGLRSGAEPLPPLLGLAFAPDGKAVAGWGEERLFLWDAGSGRLLWRDEQPPRILLQVRFSPDGKLLATRAWQDPWVRLWDPATGKEVRRLGALDRMVMAMAFSPDGRTMAVSHANWDPDRMITTRDCPVYLLDVRTGREVGRLNRHKEPALALAFWPDGRTLLSYNGRDGLIRWDVPHRRVRRHAEEPGGFPEAFSPDGRAALWEESAEGVKAVWYVEHDGARQPRRLEKLDYSHACFSPDGRYVSGLSPLRDTLYLVSLRTGQAVRSFHARFYKGYFAFSPDGRTLAYVETDRGGGKARRTTIRLFDVRTGREQGRFESDQDHVNDLTFSPDSKLLASVGADATALVWDVRSALPPDDPAVRRTRQELDELWTKLADPDEWDAYEAMWDLVASPGQAVTYLRQRLRPAPSADGRRLARLIGELDSAEFRTRERAAAELERLGGYAEPALKKALAGQPSAEVRRRLTGLLEKAAAARAAEGRDLRAVEALEHIGSPEAVGMLKELAKGRPDAPLTRAAREAADRCAAPAEGARK